MSIEFLNAAFKADIKSSSDKFVLVALSDFANENGEAYPSTETLTNKTALNRKTILSSIASLITLGLVVDTGERKGQTKQINVYKISMNRLKAIEIQSQKRDSLGKQSQKRNSTENGTLNSPKNGTLSGVKQSQKRDTEPSVILNHQIEPPVLQNTLENEQSNTETATPETPLQNATHSAPSACSVFVFDDMQDGTVSGEYIPAKPKSVKTSQNRTQGDNEAKGYGKTSKVWQAYSEAFNAAYGTYPKGNARVNGMLSQMIDRLGENDAVSVAAFYPTHPAKWYAEKMHGVGAMLADCEKLYAELQTGRVVTSKSAQQRDRGASNMAALQEAMRQYDADMARKAA